MARYGSMVRDIDVVAIGRVMYKAGISGAELSRRMGRSDGYIGGLLHRGTAPISAVYQMAGILQVEPELLLNTPKISFIEPEEPKVIEPETEPEVLDLVEVSQETKAVANALECIGVIMMSINESLIDLTTAVNDLTEALEGKEGK